MRDEGTTFATLLEDVRHRRALELVEGDRLTLNEIAQRLGFQDPSAFWRAFKRWRRRREKPAPR